MKLRYILLFATFQIIYFYSYSQDPQFSQFYSNPLYQSPSFAGTSKGYRATLNYRNQWSGLAGKIPTVSAGFDANVSPINSGLGIIMMRDVAGIHKLTTVSVGALYSYNVKISRRAFFRPGIGFYYSQININHEDMVRSSDIDAEDPNLPQSGPVNPITGDEFRTQRSVDGSVSGLFLSRDWWVGATLDHLFQPNISLTETTDKLPVKYTLYGGYRFRKLNRLVGAKKQVVTVAGTYRHQGAADQLDIGLYWTYEPLILGVWYRDLPFVKENSNTDAIIFMVGAKLKTISVGYSYDFTVSKLTPASGGAHELSLVYRFDIKQKKKFRSMPCPQF